MISGCVEFILCGLSNVNIHWSFVILCLFIYVSVLGVSVILDWMCVVGKQP